MNRQAIFTTVATHLLTQNAKSSERNADGVDCCFYRHPAGQLRCAIGALIPDALYDERMDDFSDSSASNSIRDILLRFPNLATHLEVSDGDDIKFLTELQHIHDTYDPEEWLLQLIAFATRHRLTLIHHGSILVKGATYGQEPAQ